MNKRPFFSLVTCTKNSANFVERNINSVKKQSCEDYEHIFIDGQSTDDTVGIIKQYIKQNKRVSFYSCPPKGISNAMNGGIKKARGKYIIHLHSDDWLYDDDVLRKVKKNLKKLSHPDWIYGKICVREENEDVFGYFPRFKIFKRSSRSIFSFSLLKYFNFIPHQAVFIKKKVFNNFGLFDETLSSQMDYDFWLRVVSKTNWFYVNMIISNFTIRQGAESSSKGNHKKNHNNFKKVQIKHLSKICLFEAKILSMILDCYNKIER